MVLTCPVITHKIDAHNSTPATLGMTPRGTVKTISNAEGGDKAGVVCGQLLPLGVGGKSVGTPAQLLRRHPDTVRQQVTDAFAPFRLTARYAGFRISLLTFIPCYLYLNS